MCESEMMIKNANVQKWERNLLNPYVGCHSQCLFNDAHMARLMKIHFMILTTQEKVFWEKKS